MFFDAFVQSQKALELWTRATQEQLVRMGEMAKQADEVQTQSILKTRDAIDESSRLMKASMDYAQELSNEWRRVSLELAAKATSATSATSTKV